MGKRRRGKTPQITSRPGGRDRASLVMLAFFVSGLAGVMQEIVWSRQLVRVVGAAAYAEVVVLGVFMGGLALGAAWFGRRADAQGTWGPLKTYVALEAGIAAYGLAFPLLLAAASGAYLAVASRLFELGAAKVLLRFLLAVLLFAPPAVLMGATFPVLARHLIGAPGDTRRQVGTLYSVNSAGAVIGTGLAGFFALPLLGLYESLVLASLLNLTAGALLFPAARREAPARRAAAPSTDGGESASPDRRQSAIVLLALACSGFAAMGYEVLFVRIIGLAFGSSTHAFSFMLMTFIAGIALGSWAVARMHVRVPLAWLAGSQLVLVLAFLAARPLLARLPYWCGLLRAALRDTPAGFEILHLVAAGLLMALLIVPTACLGCAFPLVAGIRVRVPERIAGRVGTAYGWSTFGNVLGVATTALVLLPRLGLARAFDALLALNLLAGLALLCLVREFHTGRRLATALAVICTSALLMVAARGWADTLTLTPGHLQRQEGDGLPEGYAAWRKRYLLTKEGKGFESVHLEEDAHNTATGYGPNPRDNDSYALSVNNKIDASTHGDLETQLLLAHAPLFLAPRARSVLVIGHGAGITVGSALRHPVDRLDVVEISPAVLKLDHLFAEANHHALTDPRVRVYVEDGQSFLRAVPRRYDVIISEPSNPWIAGVADLFTVDFLESARDRLNPGGVFCFWFHTYSQTDDTVKMLLRTLGTAFPHADLFFNADFADVIAVASVEPLRPDFLAAEQRFSEGEISEDLARIGVANLGGLLVHHGLVQNGATSLVGPGPVDTFNDERLKYEAPRSLFSGVESNLLEQLDSFLTQYDPETLRHPGDQDVLFDRYMAFRKAAGRPMEPQELEVTARHAEALGGYGPNIARALRARAENPP